MDRRVLLSLIAGTLAFPTLAKAAPPPPPQPFRLNLYNQHTRETFSGQYRNADGPMPEAMEDLSVFLRDFHCDEQIGIDVGVLDFLSHVMQAVGQPRATILSAYRTPETNDKLRQEGFAAAENSQHLYGRALDVHFGEKLAEAMRAARAMERGGVGWYPHSSFMHIDTGPVRNWTLHGRGAGTLLVGRHRIHFNKHGDRVAAAHGRSHRHGHSTVRARLSRLRKIARLEHAARHR
jgi:uncharacterized protein YcbK (DUF882 family)